MRRIHCLAVLVLIGIASPALAQPGPVQSVSHEMVIKALQPLNASFSLRADAYLIETNNRVLTLVRLEDGQKLVLRAFVKRDVPMQTLSRFNDKNTLSLRATQTPKSGVQLELTFDSKIGITTAGLTKLINRFANEIGEFETFAARDKGGKVDVEPKVVKPVEGKQPVPMQIRPESDDKELIITFPTADKDKWETAWKIVWDMETAEQAYEQGFKRPPTKNKNGEIKESPGFGRGSRVVLFKIKQAYFKPGQKAEWIQVLEDAHPSELYVPYYFRGTRFFDLRDVGGYVSLSPKEGGATSQLLSKSKRVMAELRDTGVAYKHGNITRRGEELTLWANFGAANYTYMIEYGFRDDGVIVFRHAPTGFNFFSHFDASHMHGSYWRVGMKLGPVGQNTKNQVYTVRLPIDPKDQGKDGGKLNIQEVNRESFVDWNPEEYTRLRITNPEYSIVPEAKDRPALPIGYDLVTVQQGIARHRRFPDEKFTHHDFWITRQDSPEKMYVNLGNYFFEGNEPNPKLRDLDQSNVVLWHSSSALHTPRAEDGIIGGNNTTNGQAMIFWTSFELRPRNLFMKTPIYRALP